MSRKSRLLREAAASTDTTIDTDAVVVTEPDASADGDADTIAAESTVDTTDDSAEDRLLAAIALCELAGYVVRRPIAATPRATVTKADPAEVKSYFDSTGLTRKQLAAAVGVSTSVIATVQNPNGDRWSQVRYEAAKVLIDAEVARFARIAAITAAIVAEDAAKAESAQAAQSTAAVVAA